VTTDQGFVQSIDVGRGGLATVHVLLTDGSTAVYVISDLDADPSGSTNGSPSLRCFATRWTAPSRLRLTMTRAPPARRSSAQKGYQRRPRFPVAAMPSWALSPGCSCTVKLGHPVRGLSSYAKVVLLNTSGQQRSCGLDLQFPERPTAIAQLDILRAAYARVIWSGAPDRRRRHRPGVDPRGSDRRRHRAVCWEGDETTVSGFVESLSLIPLTAPTAGSLAAVSFTTAPEFTGRAEPLIQARSRPAR